MTSEGFKAPPVPGYTDVNAQKLALVTENKHIEERVLRQLDRLNAVQGVIDPRWLAIARTHIQEGFMAANRAVFQPERIKLPEDET